VILFLGKGHGHSLQGIENQSHRSSQGGLIPQNQTKAPFEGVNKRFQAKLAAVGLHCDVISAARRATWRSNLRPAGTLVAGGG